MNALLLLLNGLLIAAIYALGKVGRELGIEPVGLLFWQIVGSLAVVLPVSLLLGHRPELRVGHLRYYLIAGLLGLTLPYLATFGALAALPAGTVGIVASLSPLITYAAASAIGLESANPQRIVGLGLGFAGALLIFLPHGGLPSMDHAAWLFLALAAPISLAAGNIYRTMGWPSGGHPIAMSAGMLAMHTVIIGPIAATSGQIPFPVSPASWALLGSLAVTSGVLYLSFFELQRRAGPIYVGQLGYVISLGALAIGAIAFGERAGAAELFAALLTVIGIILVSRQGARATPAPVAMAPSTGCGYFSAKP